MGTIKGLENFLLAEVGASAALTGLTFVSVGAEVLVIGLLAWSMVLRLEIASWRGAKLGALAKEIAEGRAVTLAAD